MDGATTAGSVPEAVTAANQQQQEDEPCREPNDESTTTNHVVLRTTDSAGRNTANQSYQDPRANSAAAAESSLSSVQQQDSLVGLLDTSGNLSPEQLMLIQQVRSTPQNEILEIIQNIRNNQRTSLHTPSHLSAPFSSFIQSPDVSESSGRGHAMMDENTSVHLRNLAERMEQEAEEELSRDSGITTFLGPTKESLTASALDQPESTLSAHPLLLSGSVALDAFSALQSNFDPAASTTSNLPSVLIKQQDPSLRPIVDAMAAASRVSSSSSSSSAGRALSTTEEAMLLNEADGPYKCTFPSCGKRFGRFYNLKSHMKTHTGERPYKCPRCEMSFSRSHDLKRHERIHTGVRPYTCDTCNKSFSRQDALNRHLASACPNRLQRYNNNTSVFSVDGPLQLPMPRPVMGVPDQYQNIIPPVYTQAGILPQNEVYSQMNAYPQNAIAYQQGSLARSAFDEHQLAKRVRHDGGNDARTNALTAREIHARIKEQDRLDSERASQLYLSQNALFTSPRSQNVDSRVSSTEFTGFSPGQYEPPDESALPFFTQPTNNTNNEHYPVPRQQLFTDGTYYHPPSSNIANYHPESSPDESSS